MQKKKFSVPSWCAWLLLVGAGGQAAIAGASIAAAPAPVTAIRAGKLIDVGNGRVLASSNGGRDAGRPRAAAGSDGGLLCGRPKIGGIDDGDAPLGRSSAIPPSCAGRRCVDAACARAVSSWGA